MVTGDSRGSGGGRRRDVVLGFLVLRRGPPGAGDVGSPTGGGPAAGMPVRPERPDSAPVARRPVPRLRVRRRARLPPSPARARPGRRAPVARRSAVPGRRVSGPHAPGRRAGRAELAGRGAVAPPAPDAIPPGRAAGGAGQVLAVRPGRGRVAERCPGRRSGRPVPATRPLPRCRRGLLLRCCRRSRLAPSPLASVKPAGPALAQSLRASLPGLRCAPGRTPGCPRRWPPRRCPGWPRDSCSAQSRTVSWLGRQRRAQQLQAGRADHVILGAAVGQHRLAELVQAGLGGPPQPRQRRRGLHRHPVVAELAARPAS